MNLIEAMTRETFHAIIILRRTAAADESADSPELVHAQLCRQIDKMMGHALACGLPSDDVQDVAYALAALADAAASRSKGPLGLHFRQEPLLTHYFGERLDHETSARDPFLLRLEAARKNNRYDVVRVYAVCLTLGYRGRMRAQEAAQALEAVHTLVGGSTESATLPTLTLEPVDVRPWQLFWLPLGAFMVSVALYVILSSSMRSDAAIFASFINALLRV